MFWGVAFMWGFCVRRLWLFGIPWYCGLVIWLLFAVVLSARLGFAGYCSIGWWVRVLVEWFRVGCLFLRCGLAGAIDLWVCCYVLTFFGGV